MLNSLKAERIGQVGSDSDVDDNDDSDQKGYTVGFFITVVI